MALVAERNEIIGRADALAAAERLLDRVAGGPAALVLAGEAGIGKTTVWNAGRTAAAEQGLRVLVSRPASADAHLPLGALGDLLGAVSPEVLSRLPGPQRRALEVALLRAEPNERDADQRALSVATTGILRELAERSAVVVAIDDVQWIDESSAGVLAFAARRLEGSHIGFLVSLRGGDGDTDPFDLEAALPADAYERLPLGSLSLAALHRLFVSRLGHSFPRLVLLRIHEDCAGNPFYALEIARALIRSGRTLVPGEPLPIPETLDRLTRERIDRLPERTRRALVVAGAAVDPTFEMLAAAGVDDPATSLLPALEDGVVAIESETVRFTHPLLERAALDLVDSHTRRLAHAALAAAVGSAEERAWHLGQAADGPDDEAASALEDSAARARARGASVDASALYLRASELTPDASGGRATARASLAADCLFVDMSDEAQAVTILERQLRRARPGPARADALSLRAMILYYQGQPRSALPLCEQALAEAGDDAVVRGRALLRLAWVAADADLPRGLELTADAVGLLESTEGDPALLSSGLLATSCAHSCWSRFRASDVERGTRLLGLSGRSLDRQFAESYLHRAGALHGRPRPSYRDLGERRPGSVGARGRRRIQPLHARRASLSGAATWDSAAAEAQAGLAAYENEWVGDRARALRAAALVAAHRGCVEEARQFADEGLELATQAEDDALAAMLLHVRGFAALSLAELLEADESLARAASLVERIGIRHPGRFKVDGDRAEVAIALGDLALGERIVSWLERVGVVAPTPWTLAVGARCRGLLEAAGGDLDAAASALERSVEEHERLPMPFERARTLLAKGRVHHRRKEKRLASETLGEASRIFDELGSPLWAERAHAELDRAGLRQRDPDELNETERRVAELAAQGLSNQEIAQRAFLSVKTVEANLTRVYRKLGIRSRAGLARRLS